MGQIKLLTEAEQTELQRVFKLSPNSRDTVILQYVMEVGIRANEALAFCKADLNADHKAVWIKAAKGSNSRLMPVSDRLYTKLKQLADSSPTEEVFNISYSRLKQIWREYSPQSCRGHNKQTAKGVHSLRHTFAVNLYKKCRNIKLVQTALGHKNIENTLVYMTYVESVTELRTAMGV
jgi:integrase